MCGRIAGARRRIVAGLAVAAIALSITTGSDADPVSRARRSPGALRQQTRTLDTRIHRALLGLYSVETRLDETRVRLAGLQRDSEQVRAEQALAQRQVGIAQHALSVSREQLGDRLRLLYERGEPDALAVLLGSASLEDAISGLDDLARTNRQSQAVIEQTRTLRQSLARRLNVLSNRRAELASLTSKLHATQANLTHAYTERAGLLGSLQTRARLNRRRIAALEATARAAEAKSKMLAAPTSTQPTRGDASATPDPPPVTDPRIANGSRTITVVATGYSMAGRTSTGLPVGWGIVAVDPAVIPLGARMRVPGYGEAVAADVGSGVQGATIDLWFPTRAQARAWGRREVTVTLG